MRTQVYPKILQKYLAAYMPMILDRTFTRDEKELYILQAIERCASDFAEFTALYQRGTENVLEKILFPKQKKKPLGLWCRWDDDDRNHENWITTDQLYEKFAKQLESK